MKYCRTMTEENPKLDISTLSLLNKKIQLNSATGDDYKMLDYFLSPFFGIDFVLNKLKENNIYSYEEYIIERTKPISQKNRAVDGLILGTIMGAISVLEKYISNQIR
jgi:hypothetical protein